MKTLFVRFVRGLFTSVHDDSLRANQFNETHTFSPYTAAMFPRF